MKKLLLSMAFLFSLTCLFAQNQYTPIENPRGAVFVQNGKKLMPRQLLGITQINPEAYKEMQKAKSNYDFGSVIGGVGGFMVGWPLGTAIGGGDPNWALAGIGAGLVLISIPLSTSYTKHSKNAVEIYNNGLLEPSTRKTSYNFNFSSNGLGLLIEF